MIHGFISPSGRPGYLHSHRDGVLNLVGRRAFVVDDKAQRVADVSGQPVVFSDAAYKDLCKAIVDGAPILLEPAAVASVAEEALTVAHVRIAELEEQLAEAKALASAEKPKRGRPRHAAVEADAEIEEHEPTP